MTNKLNLVIGKPELENPEFKNPQTKKIEKKFANAATYSRFAIPFAFRLEAISENIQPSNLYYTPNNKDDKSYIRRRKYFTRETSDTLYERGQWLSVCNEWNKTTWGKAEITVELRKKNFKIGMLAPQLVLFELPEINPQQEANILNTGFLYVDIYFPAEQTETPEIDDLLVLNEFFRYFGIPYDSHAGIFRNIFRNIPIQAEKSETIESSNLDRLACYFERWATLLEIPIKSNGQFYQLFPPAWGQAARNWMYNKKESNEAEHWQIYADNRCFVWTFALLKEGGKSLQTTFETNKTPLTAKDYGHWARLLNVDNPPFSFDAMAYKTPQHTHKEISAFERQWTD